MKRLTKKEKQRVLDACELVATDREEHCCFALERALENENDWHPVTEQFQKMFGCKEFWSWDNYSQDPDQERILALCLFWAAEGVL